MVNDDGRNACGLLCDNDVVSMDTKVIAAG